MGKKPKAVHFETASAIDQIQTLKVHISAKELFQKALKDKLYIYLIIGFLTCGFHMALITNHLPTEITSHGFTSETTTFAFSIFGITTMLGSILSGSLCNKFRMKNVLGSLYALRPIIVFVFLAMPKTTFTITLTAALLGLTGASTVPPVSGLVNRAYGAGNLGALFGLVFFVHQIGGFFGAWFGGICFNTMGNYIILWVADIIFCVFAAFASYSINENSATCTRNQLGNYHGSL
jgi:predicted MFS family arabinose efflux permease